MMVSTQELGCWGYLLATTLMKVHEFYLLFGAIGTLDRGLEQN